MKLRRTDPATLGDANTSSQSSTHFLQDAFSKDAPDVAAWLLQEYGPSDVEAIVQGNYDGTSKGPRLDPIAAMADLPAPVQVKWAAMATQVVRRDLQCTRHGDAELLVRLSIHAAHMVRCGEQLKRSSQPTRRLDHWTIEAKLQSCLDVMPAIAAASDQNQESPPPSTPPRGLQFADLMTFKLEPCA